MKTLNPKLPKLKGYFRVAGWYVSHWHVLLLLAAGLALGAVYIQALHPMVVKFLISQKPLPEIVVNSMHMEGYSGMARLVHEDGSLIYEGSLTNGMVEGRGLLYSGDALVYEGEFKDNKYSGQGKLYSGDKLLYEGGFAENRFTGNGTLYGGDGSPEYVGEFLGGEKNGKGRVYRGESLLYEGGFSSGLYEGEGKLYDIASGLLLYEGAFGGGAFNGLGKLYTKGLLLYAGSFAEGLYDGAGILYNGGGEIVYDGQWALGRYEGQGRLYLDSSLVYEGGFLGGLYNGEGCEYYPESGYLKYTGRFLSGEYMDSGIFYDEKGRQIINLPLLTPEKLINLTYSETLDLIKDAGLEYSEMELDNSHVILIESISRIIRFSKDLKSEAPGRVIAVYLCGLDAQSGALTSMVLEDIKKALGEPVSPAEIAPGAVEILALTISNVFWGRNVAAENARGIQFRAGDREITVFFETKDNVPGQALFFKVR